jgi:hypothetical protein
MSITLVHGLTLNRNGSEPERALPCTGVAIPAPPACPGRADEGQPVARRSAPHWPAARPSRLRRRLLGSLLALVGLAPGAAAAHSTFSVKEMLPKASGDLTIEGHAGGYATIKRRWLA